MTSEQTITRRRFTHIASAGALGLAAGWMGAGAIGQEQAAAGPAQHVLPRWRGFNLTYFFSRGSDCTPREEDFQWIQEWGFDFVRIPMTYTHWIEDDDVYKIKESMLERIDKVVEWGQKYNIHVNLNFHRAPGYSVNRERTEPFNLWTDEEAQKAFYFHWELFAKRYSEVPGKALSFNLLNEPAREGDNGFTRETYVQICRTSLERIRAFNPDRLIVSDGMEWGGTPITELKDTPIAQSCRGYGPMQITHYKASWVDSANYPEPAWPETRSGGWDRQRLAERFDHWAEFARQGVGVHCGEFGVHNQTPHAVTLAWMNDQLDILTGHNIGFALWNFRGSFGIINSGRSDVEYEDWHGVKLDRAMLSLLQKY